MDNKIMDGWYKGQLTYVCINSRGCQAGSLVSTAARSRRSWVDACRGHQGASVFSGGFLRERRLPPHLKACNPPACAVMEARRWFGRYAVICDTTAVVLIWSLLNSPRLHMLLTIFSLISLIFLIIVFFFNRKGIGQAAVERSSRTVVLKSRYAYP